MKASSFVTLGLLSQVCLAVAVPHAHGHHAKFHADKRAGPSQRTETVTVTDYSAVVWVDSKGQIISTEFRTPPPASLAVLVPATIPVASTPPTSPSTTQSSSVPSSSAVNSQAPAAAAAAAAAPPIQNKQQENGNKGSSSGAVASGIGICYDAIDSSSKCKDAGTINSEFAFLKSQGYAIVRVYDVGCNIGDFAAAASNNGLKLMPGVNTIFNLAGDLGKLTGMVNGNWGPIDTVYVGNELVNNGIASAEQVAGAVSAAKGILGAAGYHGNVVTVDTFNAMQSNPTICSTSDYCAANAHAFFDPHTSAENAGNFVKNAHSAVQAANGGKRVVITETGWPWKGNCNSAACPGTDAQQKAMTSIIQAFSDQPSNVFLFQAYDAGYKQPGALGIEQFFGLYDSDHYGGHIGS